MGLAEGMEEYEAEYRHRVYMPCTVMDGQVKMNSSGFHRMRDGEWVKDGSG